MYKRVKLYIPVCVWTDKWCFQNEVHRYIDIMGYGYKVVEYDPNQHKEANQCEW